MVNWMHPRRFVRNVMITLEFVLFHERLPG